MQAIVIAPDPEERDVFAFVLRRAGLAIAASGDYERVLSNWGDHPADLILLALDVGEDLNTVTKTVRAATQAPLFLISEPLPENEIAQSLRDGVDVVVTRPASAQLIAAQAIALLRRANAVPAFVLPNLDLGPINLDPSTRTVQVGDNRPQRLTQLEFRLLYFLMTNRGQVLPTEVIVERVWGYTGEGNRDLVRGLVSRLRHKIEPNPEQPQFLETLSGVGYRFVIDEI
jgi:DNA-binding response OmpR family regulator